MLAYLEIHILAGQLFLGDIPAQPHSFLHEVDPQLEVEVLLFQLLEPLVIVPHGLARGAEAASAHQGGVAGRGVANRVNLSR